LNAAVNRSYGVRELHSFWAMISAELLVLRNGLAGPGSLGKHSHSPHSNCARWFRKHFWLYLCLQVHRHWRS